ASINRIYYACFYAVSGLLLKQGIDTSTHKGIRQMFGLHYVQTNLISKGYARFFSDLYDRRQTGDYDDFVLYDEETSKKLFSMAKEFVQEIDSLIKQENN
ncbi:MAG: HEPN domain-containing protein, partial [Bacteroidota bacterium]|nr:HEPN domain-containing protein [Bacteroidota bacterium]